MPDAYIPSPGTFSSSSLWRMVNGAMSGGGRGETGGTSSSDMSESDPEVPDPRGTGRLDADDPLLFTSGGMAVVRFVGGACAILGGGYAMPRPGMMPTSSEN